MKIALIVGVGIYFLIRIYLRFRNRKLIKKGSVSWQRKLIFLAIDFCIILATILQLKFPEIGQMPLGEYGFIIQVFGFSLFLIGIFLSSWSRLTLGRNWVSAGSYDCNYRQSLVTRGPYAFLRHPIYAGMFFMGLGFELTLLNWLFLGIIPSILFFYHQATLEEKLLKKNFPQYEKYQAETKMFLPGIF